MGIELENYTCLRYDLSLSLTMTCGYCEMHLYCEMCLYCDYTYLEFACRFLHIFINANCCEILFDANVLRIWICI